MMRYMTQRRAQRHGLLPTERELEMYRLRMVEGLSLREIGERFEIGPERVRQLLALHFDLRGTTRPPTIEVAERQALVALGAACRQLRQERSLTKTHVAKAAGIARARLVALESGRLDADLPLLMRLAHSLNVRAAALLQLAEDLQSQATP